MNAFPLKFTISSIIYLSAFFFLVGCTGMGEALKTATNSGYNSWTIEYTGSFSEVTPYLVEILEDLDYEIESNTGSNIETKYRVGPARYDSGGFFSSLNQRNARDGMIKLSIENREHEGKSYLFFRTFTQLENRYSSYSRSNRSNPEWGLWEDELMFISEQLKEKFGNGEEMGRYFVRSAGDARIN